MMEKVEKCTTLAIISYCLLLIGYTQAQVIEEPYVRPNLTLRIVVKYPESKLTNSGLPTDLFVVGNGLGLAWNDPQLMLKPSQLTDTWWFDLKFSASMDGYVCSDCKYNNVLPVSNSRLEYRILTSNRTDMVGPNFGLVIHSTSKMESSTFPIREHISYPYFFTTTGTVQVTRVDSAVNPYIGSRSWSYYLPPSFNENSFKTYPTFLVPDLRAPSMEAFRPQLERILVEQAIAEEAVLIGSQDYDVPEGEGRTSFLTPTPGIFFYCINGSASDRCAGCVPENVTDPREQKEYMRDRCGYTSVVGGHGEQYIDYMVNEVLPAIQVLTKDRLKVSRDNLGIGGCSLGGLLSCHALWTRPDTFGMGWCKSASFWWPPEADCDNGFYFLNHTIKTTNLGPRAPQKIYVDVTDLEDDPYYAQLGAALQVVDTMVANSPQFRLDETLWFTLVNGQTHGSWNCLTRTWNSLALVNPPSGAPRNPNPTP